MELIKVNNETLREIISNNLPLYNLDTTEVTDMCLLFHGTSYFNPSNKNPELEDISNWNVSNVITMDKMFFNRMHFNQDISNWNVSNVVDMSSMFQNCYKFNQDISSWDTKSLKYSGQMFLNCQKFNQDISKWNLSELEHLSKMLYGCISFNQNLKTLNLPKAKNLFGLFEKCIQFDFQMCFSFDFLEHPNTFGENIFQELTKEKLLLFCFHFKIIDKFEFKTYSQNKKEEILKLLPRLS